jgi:hypothetical protein
MRSSARELCFDVRVNWYAGKWRPVWRLHPWVRWLWVLADAALLVTTVSVVMSGFDSLAFSASLSLTLALQIVHERVAELYRRRDSRLRSSS